MKKLIFGTGLLILSAFFAFAQEVRFQYNGGRNYTLIERTDLRRYENNRYVGLLSREVRSFIVNSGRLYEGSFYVSQDTVRASAVVGDRIHDSIPSRFKIDVDGNLTMIEDHGYPSFRSFPAFTSSPIKIGDSWKASAVRAVDPLNKGIVTKMPMYVLYTYTGDENIRGEDVYVLSAKWATRYGPNLYLDFGGDRDLQQAHGKHEATMYVSKATGNAIVVRDSVDETFVYADGKAVTFRGTISLFTEYPPAVDRSKIIRALQRVAGLSDSEAKQLAKNDNTTGMHDEKKQQDNMTIPTGGDLQKTVAKQNNTVAKNDSTAGLQNNKKVQTQAQQQSQSQVQLQIDKNKSNKVGATVEKQTAKSNAEIAGTANSSTKKTTAKQKTTVSSIENAIAAANGAKKSALGTKTGILDSGSDSNSTAVTPEASEKAIQEAAKPIKVEDTEAGIRLTIQNLQFKPDSAELIAGEKSRLDQIASVLREVPQSQFLVEGHTASTGYEEGEMRLSAQRAHAIAKELAARGIPAERFICKGSGAHKPIADNRTPQGKAVNRRVEITILE